MDERKVYNIGIEIVNDVSGLIKMEEIWHDLERNSDIYPFNTFEWIINWWKYFGYGKKLWVLLIHDGQLPIGIAPFMVTFGEKGLPVRRIKFIGSNNSDYLDFVVRRGYESQFYANLVSFLERKINPFTVLDLEHLPERSEIFPFIMGSSLYYDYDVQDICPYIELPSDWDEYIGSLDGKFRRNLNYETRRFFKDYNGIFSYIADADMLDTSMDRLIELHQERWRKRHMPGAFYSKKIRDFHKDVAHAMLLKGALSLYELKNGEKIVSSLLSYHIGRKRYYYISGYDLEYSKRSVGTITLGLAVKSSIEDGDEIFDFLRGDEEYKKNWTSLKKKNMRLVASYPSIAGKLYSYYIIAENKLVRKIKDRFSE